MRHLALIALVVSCACIAGCSEGPTQPVNCPDIVRYAVRLTLTDSASGTPIGDAEAWLFAQNYEERMERWPTGEFLGGSGRSGTVTVLAIAEGYVPWLMEQVRVARDHCGPITRNLAARLRRSQS